MTEKRLRFGRFRQKMCNLLWENNCYDGSLSEDVIAKIIFNQAHRICNELVKEYDIKDR